MGSGTSKKPEDKAKEVMNKLAVVQAMDTRHVKPPAHATSRPSGLHDYLAKRKADKEENDLAEEDPQGPKDTGRELHKERPEDRERREREAKLYAVPNHVSVGLRVKVECSNIFCSKNFSNFFYMMGIRVCTLHNKKRYAIGLLFSELSSEITNYRVFYRKIAIFFKFLNCHWS